MKIFRTIDEVYVLGKLQKSNLIDGALPNEIQRDVDKEHAKGVIPDYEDFIEFIKDLSISSRFPFTQARAAHSQFAAGRASA